MAEWHKRVTEEVLAAAAGRLDIASGELRHVGGFENMIYSYHKDNRECMLRVSHTLHRPEEQVISEMHWVDYLARHGVNVAKPLPFPSGKLVERLEAGADKEGCFLLAISEKAPGRHVNGGSPEWGRELFEGWGEITGRMHAAARGYTLPPQLAPRPSEDTAPADPFEPRTAGETEVRRVFEAYAEQIRRLERTPDSYGLCHRDLHQGNFHVHDGAIVAFDFDDCGYDHFVQDIAMAVYYASSFPEWRKPVADAKLLTESANVFLDAFLTGYGRANRLDSRLLKQLPLFIERRRADLTLILREAWSRPEANPDQRRWLEWNMRELAEGRACMELHV